MKDEIFYLPKHPINSEKHILDWFYTNELLEDIVHFTYRKPTEFSMTVEPRELPSEPNALRLSYRRTEPPNCEGVSRYELVKNSR